MNKEKCTRSKVEKSRTDLGTAATGGVEGTARFGQAHRTIVVVVAVNGVEASVVEPGRSVNAVLTLHSSVSLTG